LSGPAGGIVGMAKTAAEAGFDQVIGFDMGGTSTDVSHFAGVYERTSERAVAGVRVRAPMLEIHTVAAGGGSVCIYDGQRFRVGAEGFVRSAVDNMANAIKQLSIARGHDVTRYVLQCFGGAGGQHACLVADALGIGTVMIHPLAGVLSAYGMGLADLVELRQRSLSGDELEAALAALEAEAVAALAAQGVEAPEVLRRAALRYEGSDTALEV